LLALILLLALGVAGCDLTSDDSTDTPPPTATTAAAPITTVLYFAATEGVTGPIGPIGCDSYLVPVPIDPAPGDAPLDQQITYALTQLFAVKDQPIGDERLYNTLAQSSPVVESVTVDAAGQATILLTGQYSLSGVCADPLFKAQIEYTALQFPGVTSVSVFIDGVPIADVISGR
jgi:hypothetical protein